MTTTYDVIVVGLGGMGSAAAYRLALRGKRVLGLERHTAGHNNGSSHGYSRVIRQAYFEDPAYVPLLLRAYELWEELERNSGKELMTLSGGLMMGRADSGVFTGSLRSAQEHGLEHEILDATEIRRRYPMMHPWPGIVGLYEKKAGFVHPEGTVCAHLDLAAKHGATLQFEEPALRWEVPASDRVRVTTARGVYEAERLVIAPGAWAPQILGDLGLPLRVERQVLHWFDPVGGTTPFLPDRFPIYIWEADDGMLVYGFPAQSGPPGGVKVAFFYRGEDCTADTIRREVREDEIEFMQRYAVRMIPALEGKSLGTATCLYTLTPDHHFVLSAHPQHENVVIASPCSGHGYKFASVVGEVLADLVVEGTTRHPIALFSPKRFGG